MKKHILGFIALLMLTLSINSQAAYIAPAAQAFTAIPAATGISAYTGSDGTQTPAKHRHRTAWQAITAISCAVVGLWVPLAGMLAVIFGSMALGRKKKLKGLGITAFILGVLEVAAFIIVIAAA